MSDVPDDQRPLEGDDVPVPFDGEPAAAVVPRQARHGRRRSRRRPWVWVGVVAAIVLLGLVSWYEVSSHPFGGPGRRVTLEISTGESYSGAVSSFERAGVISDALAFKVYSAIHGAPTVLPGFYTAPTNSTFGYVHALLSTGPNTMAIKVPPGFTLQEVANRLNATVNAQFADTFAGLLRSGAVRSPYEPAGTTNLEGLIGPGTYLITPATTPQALLASMVSRFSVMARAAGLPPDATPTAMAPYTVITIASVVEKEGYYVKNMPQVATVIYNRLAKGMPLQMDSTVLYALGQDGGPVTAQTLKYQSPYNTYLHTGLPPTPICTVSSSALNAALHPPTGTWLYFTLVSKDGTMAFANTFQEQLKNEALAASRGL